MTQLPAPTHGTALITGAARRIGRAIAERLATEGYAIALHTSARSEQEAQAVATALRAQGGQAHVLVADLARVEEVARLVPDATQALGPVRVLVNNASLFASDTAARFDTTLFDQMMAINLRAPVALAHDLVAALPAGERAAIINLIDQRVWRLTPQFFSYTLSKSALWTATQTLAQSFAPHVRVNGVGPGPILPNINDGPEGFAHEAANVPLGHAPDPSEIAAAVAYLVAARSVTGQMIAVDSGQHLAWRTPDIVGDI